MLQALRRDHLSNSAFFYLDVSIEETLRRHQTRPLRTEVSDERMREWYRHMDVLPGEYETVIPEDSPLQATVLEVLRDSGLADTMTTLAG